MDAKPIVADRLVTWEAVIQSARSDHDALAAAIGALFSTTHPFITFSVAIESGSTNRYTIDKQKLQDALLGKEAK